MAPKASSSRSRSRSRGSSRSELAYRGRVAHAYLQTLQTLRSRADLADLTYADLADRIASLERQCEYARTVVSQIADIYRSQEDRFQELCGRVDMVARVCRLQENRFRRLRNQVNSVTSANARVLERATQAEREALALQQFATSMQQTHNMHMLQLDDAFSSLWSRYINHLSSTRDILEACEGISAETYRAGITGRIPCGLLRAARNSVPDESNPDPLVLFVLARNIVPDESNPDPYLYGHPYVDGQETAASSSTDGLPLPRSGGPALAAVAEADTASREVFSAHRAGELIAVDDSGDSN